MAWKSAVCLTRGPPPRAQNRLRPAFAVLVLKWRATPDDDEHYVYAIAL
jgi:hypothetical protein